MNKNKSAKAKVPEKKKQKKEDEEYKKYIQQSNQIISKSNYFCIVFESLEKINEVGDKLSIKKLLSNKSFKKIMIYLNRRSTEDIIDFVSVSIVDEKLEDKVKRDTLCRKVNNKIQRNIFNLSLSFGKRNSLLDNIKTYKKTFTLKKEQVKTIQFISYQSLNKVYL